MLADDIFVDDRRRVVNAGVRQGRDVVVATCASPTAGDEHEVDRHRDPRGAPRPSRVCPRTATNGRRFRAEMLSVVEIDADNRIAAHVMFDLDDIDAAFEELDARYLAGEAAAHAHTWSVITRAYAALNRHEIPATTPDLVNIDHRSRVAIGAGDLTAYHACRWDLTPDLSIYIEAVHRLSDLGAVVTHAAMGPRKRASTPSGE